MSNYNVSVCDVADRLSDLSGGLADALSAVEAATFELSIVLDELADLEIEFKELDGLDAELISHVAKSEPAAAQGRQPQSINE